MSDHIDDSTTDAEIEATVMRDQIRSEGEMSAPGIEKLAGLAHVYNDEIYRLELRVQELEKRIALAKVVLPDVDNDIVREALWEALEGK